MSNKPLGANALNLADYMFPRFAAEVPAGTTVEDVLDPIFLRNFTHQIKVGAQVDLLSTDLVLDVSLRVTQVSKTEIHTRVIRDSCVVTEAGELPDGITVGFGGPKHKWRFLVNGEVESFGYGSQAEAEAAALAYDEKAA